MQVCVGIAITEHIAAGLVKDKRVAGAVHRDGEDAVRGVPAGALIERLADEAAALAKGESIDAVGVAFPGIIRGGVIEESPNLPQLKGFEIEKALRAALAARNVGGRMKASNDADAVAAGLAAAGLAGERPEDRLIRVWTLGNGIGFGRYPASEGVWEGGHTVVTLDPNEAFCACGGKGHLEGIMGHRAMRLRFLDREPEEVFEAGRAAEPDERCQEFVILWHRALAAATATSIHLLGPGKFFLTGMNSRFADAGLLTRLTQEMVKMSPLQNFTFEMVAPNDELAVTGAALNALGSD